MSESLPIKGIHHVEFIVGNALQAAYFYRKAFGFTQFAYMGPETGVRDRVSYALRQGGVNLVLTSPLSHEDARNVFLTLHGDSAKDVCFEVADVDAAFQSALDRGAIAVTHPHDIKDDAGTVRRATIRTYGDAVHSFVSLDRYNGCFHFQPFQGCSSQETLFL